MRDSQYEQLKRSIVRLPTIDIDAYKTEQMRRRIEMFIAAHGGGDPVAFQRALGTDKALLAQFRDMLTINVSEFFRDAQQFERLRTDVLSELLERRPALSIWSAACSNGQEPYMLAILLGELGARARILATDFDRSVLPRARAGGPYAAQDLRGVTAARRVRYFVEREGGTYVVDTLRAYIQVTEHNLLSSPYGRDYDLIVCRNVLIYFQAEVKVAILRKFRVALRPGGVLFIGGTEALLGAELEGFRPLGGNFYQRPAEESAGRRVTWRRQPLRPGFGRATSRLGRWSRHSAARWCSACRA
ncbi:MAG: protein-glutamate O-methyltransferase CheR [Chloroflexi bacterium]|nr:protein-glutamate O-methyltransferase CheR [Chloroflexota bacterium]